MAELAWPADLGHGTFTGRFGFMDADSHDEDREPDITSATGGTVTITPSIKSVRYTGVSGPMSLAARPAKGVIDAEGYLCTMNAEGAAGDRGMVFPATDDTDLTPTDWTYSVLIVLDGGVRLPSFNVKLPTGVTVDLSLAVPVDTSGGTAVVVDPTTATRAEAAAVRAETAADEAEGYAPTFVWDGTKLVIDGGDPVDLKGEQGTTAWADLTGKPATYPSTIPEVDGLQAALDGLITLDTSAGTRVFARGVMLHGDTGWRRIDMDLLNGWGSLTDLGAIYNPAIRRIGPMVYFRYRSLNAGNATNEQFYIAPSGFRPPASTSGTAWFGTQKRVLVDGSGGMSINGLPTSPGEAGEMQWMTTQAWPTSLPGDPA